MQASAVRSCSELLGLVSNTMWSCLFVPPAAHVCDQVRSFLLAFPHQGCQGCSEQHSSAQVVRECIWSTRGVQSAQPPFIGTSLGSSRVSWLIFRVGSPFAHLLKFPAPNQLVAKWTDFFFSLTEVMPYESFKNTHSVSIRGLAQDQHTGAWRYVLQVTTKMQERSFIEDQPSPIEEEKDHSKVETTPPDHLHASPMAASCASHVYCIRRSWSEFKQMHREMAPIMGSELPALPTESIVTFFLGETQSSLLKRRMRLEAILKAIEGHAIASDASAYLEFLANRETYDRQPQVTPLSPVASYRHSSRGQRRMSSEVRGASSALNVEYLRFSLH